MNKTNAHLYLPLVRDLAAGLTIQANRGTVDAPMWVDLVAEDGEVAFTCAPHLYRVDPGDLCAQEAGNSATTEITIWQINDVEWWIGAGTRESILEAYMEASGVSHEDATGDENEWPEPLIAEALDSLKFVDSDEDERPVGEPRTFREQLAIEVAQGGSFPRLFASTEH